MTGLTVQPAGRGLPGIPRARKVQPVNRYLEATVVYEDGRVQVEHDERNDERGRKAMDAWCWERNRSGKVSYIAVEPTSRRAGYGSK